MRAAARSAVFSLMWATPTIGGRAGPTGVWAIRTEEAAGATRAAMRRYLESMTVLYTRRPPVRSICLTCVSMKALLLLVAASQLCAQAPDASPTAPPSVPDWALPGSATHTQVPPPLGFHRPGRNFDAPIGIFEGQSDIGAALVTGSASYDSATRSTPSTLLVTNLVQRDEFRLLWKKMSGDISLAADVRFPIPRATAIARPSVYPPGS